MTMRKQTVVAAFTAALVAIVTAPVSAQGPGRAMEVIAAARKAIGERQLDTLETFSAEMKLQRNVGTFQMNADVEVLLDMPDKYARLETSSGGMNFTSTTGFNGDRSLMRGGAPGGSGVMFMRMGPGGPEPDEQLTAEQQEEMNRNTLRAARHEISRMALGWFAMAHPSLKVQYTYVGEAESPDGRADVIEAKDADGFEARLFIDQQTHLPLMVTYKAPKRTVMGAGARMSSGGAPGVQVTPRATTTQRPLTEEERKKAGADAQAAIDAIRNQPRALVDYTLFFSEWADVGGIKFPHKIQRAVEGTTEEEWTVGKVKVNPKVDAKKFQVQG
jgi:hypothetical protein